MVRSLRESLFGQIFLGAIVVAIILAFALTGSTGGAGVVSDCAISVGKRCIAPKEFLAAYGLVTSVGINERAAKSLNLKQQVARGLAEREVLLQRARELGIATSEADVDVELAEGRTRVSLPAKGAESLALSLALCVDQPGGCAPGTIGLRSLPVKADGTFNYAVYKRSVRVATGRSPGHFKEAQQKEMTADRVRDFYRAQVQVSEEEAFLAYRRARSQATARVARIQSAWFSRFLIEAEEAEISAWAKKNEEAIKAAIDADKSEYKDGCPLVSELRLSAVADEEDEPAADLAKLRAQARSSERFAALAREYSVASSADFGGVVGCLDDSYGPVSEVLLPELEGMKEGTVSGVIDTVEGPMLIRVDGHVQPGSGAETKRAMVARRLYVAAQAKEAAKKYAESLIARLKAGEAMTEANEALIDETLESATFAGALEAGKSSAAKPTTDISRQFTIAQNPLNDSVGEVLVSKLVFDLEEPDAVVQTPVEIQPGYAVLQLKEKDIATREDFADDRGQVIERLRARKAEELLSQVVDSLIERAGGVTMDRGFIPENEVEEEATTEESSGS